MVVRAAAEFVINSKAHFRPNELPAPLAGVRHGVAVSVKSQLLALPSALGEKNANATELMPPSWKVFGLVPE